MAFFTKIDLLRVCRLLGVVGTLTFSPFDSAAMKFTLLGEAAEQKCISIACTFLELQDFQSPANHRLTAVLKIIPHRDYNRRKEMLPIVSTIFQDPTTSAADRIIAARIVGRYGTQEQVETMVPELLSLAQNSIVYLPTRLEAAKLTVQYGTPNQETDGWHLRVSLEEQIKNTAVGGMETRDQPLKEREYSFLMFVLQASAMPEEDRIDAAQYLLLAKEFKKQQRMEVICALLPLLRDAKVPLKGLLETAELIDCYGTPTQKTEGWSILLSAPENPVISLTHRLQAAQKIGDPFKARDEVVSILLPFLQNSNISMKERFQTAKWAIHKGNLAQKSATVPFLLSMAQDAKTPGEDRFEAASFLIELEEKEIMNSTFLALAQDPTLPAKNRFEALGKIECYGTPEQKSIAGALFATMAQDPQTPQPQREAAARWVKENGTPEQKMQVYIIEAPFVTFTPELKTFLLDQSTTLLEQLPVNVIRRRFSILALQTPDQWKETIDKALALHHPTDKGELTKEKDLPLVFQKAARKMHQSLVDEITTKLLGTPLKSSAETWLAVEKWLRKKIAGKNQGDARITMRKCLKTREAQELFAKVYTFVGVFHPTKTETYIAEFFKKTRSIDKLDLILKEIVNSLRGIAFERVFAEVDGFAAAKQFIAQCNFQDESSRSGGRWWMARKLKELLGDRPSKAEDAAAAFQAFAKGYIESLCLNGKEKQKCFDEINILTTLIEDLYDEKMEPLRSRDP